MPLETTRRSSRCSQTIRMHYFNGAQLLRSWARWKGLCRTSVLSFHWTPATPKPCMREEHA